MIELHSQPTPNGQKIMIMLEEAGLVWKHIDVNVVLGEQFTPQHLKLNPNNKIPAIVDTNGPGGVPYSMMESGAILVYLAEKVGRFLSREPRAHYDTLQWLFFQMAHVGPMFGQANHFNATAEANEYSRNRYNNEVKRIYRVLDNRLRESPWLGCGEYSIADMATYPWTRKHQNQSVDRTSHPHFMQWFDAMEARTAVQRSNTAAVEISARMAKHAQGKKAVDVHDTKDNAERLQQATMPTAR